eukprot:296483-Chlamydomonas_euryale.AAC.1
MPLLMLPPHSLLLPPALPPLRRPSSRALDQGRRAAADAAAAQHEPGRLARPLHHRHTINVMRWAVRHAAGVGRQGVDKSACQSSQEGVPNAVRHAAGVQRQGVDKSACQSSQGGRRS